MELAHRGGMPLLAQVRSKKGRFLGIGVDPSRRKVLPQPVVKVEVDGDLALIACLFPESGDPGLRGPRA